jgi:hypothetical protein
LPESLNKADEQLVIPERCEPEVVLGGTVAALAFAVRRNIPVLFVQAKTPLSFHKYRKRWIRYAWLAAYYGLLWGGEPITNISVQETDTGVQIDVFANNVKLFIISAHHVHIFYEEDIIGLPTPITIKQKEYSVLDWFYMGTGTRPTHYDYLAKPDVRLAKRIFFFPFRRRFPHKKSASNRTSRRFPYAHAAAFSDINEEELSLEYSSETYIKILVERVMRKRLHLKQSICHKKREILTETRNQYLDTPRLHFNHDLLAKIEALPYLEPKMLRTGQFLFT